MGENQSVSSNQIQNVLGSEQVKALAAKMGVDPDQASHFLAEYLPKIVDKLTPEGKVDPTADPPTGFGQPASGALAKPRQQPKGDGANIAVGRVGRWPGAMTVIEIRPHR